MAAWLGGAANDSPRSTSTFFSGLSGLGGLNSVIQSVEASIDKAIGIEDDPEERKRASLIFSVDAGRPEESPSQQRVNTKDDVLSTSPPKNDNGGVQDTGSPLDEWNDAAFESTPKVQGGRAKRKKNPQKSLLVNVEASPAIKLGSGLDFFSDMSPIGAGRPLSSAPAGEAGDDPLAALLLDPALTAPASEIGKTPATGLTAAAREPEGTPQAQEREGTPQAQDREGTPQAQDREGTPQAQDREGVDHVDGHDSERLPGDDKLAPGHDESEQVDELKRLLGKREQQLGAMAEESGHLMTENQALKERVAEMEELMDNSSAGQVEELKEEFSHLLAKKEQDMNKAKKRAVEAQNEVKSLKEALASNDLANELEERNALVAELRNEGERLSVTVGEKDKTIRSLRSKAKDDKAMIEALEKKLKTAEDSLSKATSKLSSEKQSNRSSGDALSNVNKVLKATQKDLGTKEQLLAEANAKGAELQAGLDMAQDESAALRRQVEELKRTVENNESISTADAEQRMHDALAVRDAEADAMEQQLNEHIQALTMQLAETQTQASAREQRFNKEVKEMEARVQEAGRQNESLAAGIPEATRPLMRRIENLQLQLKTRTETLESVEDSMMQRVEDAEAEALRASEKARAASQKATQLNGELVQLRAHNETLVDERARAERARDDTQRQKDEADLTIARLEEQMKEADEARDEDTKIVRAENVELKRLVFQLREELDSREVQVPDQDLRLQLQHIPGPEVGNDEMPLSAASSRSDLLRISMEGDAPLKSSAVAAPSLVGTSTWSGQESTQALLRQKEGELSALQKQLTSVEEQRAHLEDQVVAVSHENEAMAEELNGLLGQRKSLEDEKNKLMHKFYTTLELLGEKDEQMEDLTASLNLYKSMYKTNLNQLASELESERTLRIGLEGGGAGVAQAPAAAESDGSSPAGDA